MVFHHQSLNYLNDGPLFGGGGGGTVLVWIETYLADMNTLSEKK